MVRKRSLRAERERDIAIEEAAMACLEADELRKEVNTLRRELQTCETERDLWSQRHQQILWHVGAMAEVLWCAFQQSVVETGMISVERAKLLALESFAQIVPKEDARVYEEMHDLYAKIAHMEVQQTKMTDKVRELKRINDELLEKQLWCDEMHGQECPVSEKELVDERNSNQGGSRSTQNTQLAAVHPHPGANQLLEASSGESVNVTDQSQIDARAIELLQAQLVMHIKYTKRHPPNGQTAPANGRMHG